MILIGVILVAAACIVVGLALHSVGWLVASIVASVLAGLFLAYTSLRSRRERNAATDVPAEATASHTDQSGDTAFAHAAAAAAVRSADASPADVSAARTPASSAPASGSPAASHGAPVATDEPRRADDQRGYVTQETSEDGDRMVLVVDGSPDYHVEGCERLSGEETIAIPHGQAVEDGFAPCRTCEPDAAAAAGRQVWVADGYPYYHDEGCGRLSGRESVAIPLTQAVEDGFSPCTDCAPDSSAAAAASTPTSGAAATVVAEVWVVDGFPSYHRADCVELVGQAGTAIPRSQAVEDGFAECAICTPEAATAKAAPTEPAASGSAPASAAPASADPAESADSSQPADGGQQSVVGAASDSGSDSNSDSPSDSLSDSGSDSAAAGEVREVLVADGYPDFHIAGCPSVRALPNLVPLSLDDAVSFGFAACTVCEPLAGPELPPAATEAAEGEPVLVVDGRPDYHRAGCRELDGLSEEPIPHDQAVADGFTPCSVCQPEADTAPADYTTGPAAAADASAGASDADAKADTPTASTATGASGDARETVRLPAAAVVAGAASTPTADATDGPGGGDGADAPLREVLVVDGYPNFHRPGCSELTGLDEEPVPYDQAVEDGFAPCAVCRPDAPAAPTGTDAAPAAPPAQVLVVDGYPDYHLDGCAQLTGLNSEPVPYEQAVEDGFAPCSVCRPDSGTAAPTTPPEDTATEDTAADQAVPDSAPAGAEPAEPVAQDATLTTPVAEPEPAVSDVPPAVDEPAAAEPVAEPVAEPAAEPAAAEPAAGPTAEPVAAGTGEVWVVEGRPRFHAQDCLIIKGQSAQPLSREQAEQDGFRACSLCQR